MFAHEFNPQSATKIQSLKMAKIKSLILTLLEAQNLVWQNLRCVMAKNWTKFEPKLEKKALFKADFLPFELMISKSVISG